MRSVKDGNPFIALRVPEKLLAAYRAKARSVSVHPNDLLRRFMADIAGVDENGDPKQEAG